MWGDGGPSPRGALPTHTWHQQRLLSPVSPVEQKTKWFGATVTHLNLPLSRKPWQVLEPWNVSLPCSQWHNSHWCPPQSLEVFRLSILGTSQASKVLRHYPGHILFSHHVERFSTLSLLQTISLCHSPDDNQAGYISEVSSVHWIYCCKEQKSLRNL